MGGNAIDPQLSEVIDQTATSDVHHEVEVPQKVCTKDGMVHLSDDECPVKRASES